MQRWHVTDIAWPSTPDAYDACMKNARQLMMHGVSFSSGVDAFDMGSACRRLGIRDLDSVGLVLWSGMHPRRHAGKDTLFQQELKQLKWYHTDFLAAALDMLSSSLPQATVIACDHGKWADNLRIPLDHKPLVTFRTHYGTVDGCRFHSEASGFDGRHVRRQDTDKFLGCGLVGPFLRFICGQQEVDIPELAMLVAEAGLHVIFVGEYTCGQSLHCLRRARRALASRTQLHRMLCDHPWERLPEPRRGWKRGSGDVWSLIEFREEAREKVMRKLDADRLVFGELHSENNWRRAVSRGRAGVSDYGHTMWPAV